jgi:hypothetical protein
MVGRWPEGEFLSTTLPPSTFPPEALRAPSK